MPFLSVIKNEVIINNTNINLLKKEQSNKNRKGVYNPFTAFFKRLFSREELSIVKVEQNEKKKTYYINGNRYNKIQNKASVILRNNPIEISQERNVTHLDKGIPNPNKASVILRNNPIEISQERNVTHLDKGIPNPSRTSCWVNSAVVSFYPLRHLIEGSDDPIFKAMLEVYQDPKNDKEKLAKLIKQEMEYRPKDKGWSNEAFMFLIDRLIKLDPAKKSLFKAELEGYECVCGRENRKVERGANYRHLPDCDQIKPHIFSEFIPKFLERKCDSLDCKEVRPRPEKHPKYLFVNVLVYQRIPEISLDQTEFEWNRQRFRIVSILETTGSHAICNVRGEDEKWYRYDDGKPVREVDVTEKPMKYQGFLIENLSVN